MSQPTLDALLAAMAAASVGDLRARVSVPPNATDGPLTTLAHALNILLSDLEARERTASLHSERLRTLLAHLPTGVVIAEAPSGRIVFTNRAAERFSGGPVPDADSFASYSGHWPAFHEDGRPVAPDGWPLARAIQRAEVVREEILEMRLPGAPARWISCDAAPVLDAAGAVTGAILVFEDITQRRDTQRREAESDAFRRMLLEGLSDAGVGFVVSDGRHVLMANEAYARMVGRTPEELVGIDTTLLVVPEERAEGAARQAARLAARAGQAFRCTHLRPDGVRVPSHVIGKPLRGDPPRFLAIVRDLTDEERARHEAEAARRQVAQSEKLSALGSLVSGVAHEVRTPLTYLQNNLHLLQRRLERALAKPDADPALRELMPDLATTLEAAERIERLVEDLRRYTRLRASEPHLAPLHECARQGIDLFRATHRGGTEVREELEATPDVLVDALGAQQVVLNLLANAVEASGSGGSVVARTAVDAGGALLEVRDEGPGIPADVAARIFDPFFTTKAYGTGLGLSIVRRIVDEAGGTIELDTTPGAGTTFRVRLPRAAAGAPSAGAGQREGI